MKIIWHGHSCFEIITNQWTAVIDPYGDHTVPGFKPLDLAAHAVFCSHQHSDHNNIGAVRILPETATIGHEEIQTYHDAVNGKKRGANLIHILDDGDTRVAHLGDLGCELSPEQKAKLYHLDALMVPIGGTYTIDAATAKALMNSLQPKVVIPMHYRSDAWGNPVLTSLDAYTNLCDDVVYHDVNGLELTAGTEKQTAVLALHLS